MKINDQLKKFTELRFEYYSSGRTIWFNDNMETAAILLGYAVELSLKQILVATGNDKDRKLMKSHDISLLFEKANATALNDAFPVSEDLLHFVTDRLHHRYPSQVEQTSQKANDRGHAACLALNVIAAYDDLIIGLDEWLREKLSENNSLAILAAHFINRVTGRAVFHCNSAALSKSDIYRKILENEYGNAERRMREEGLTPETIQYNLTNQKQRLKSWESAPNGIWLADHLTTRFGEKFYETPKDYKSDAFVYPGKIFRSTDPGAKIVQIVTVTG